MLTALLNLDLLDRGLAGQTVVEQLKVALLFGEFGLFTKLLFLFVVPNEVLVTLQV